MAWHTGSWGALAAGQFHSILDTYLCANSHWTLYDPAAEANIKVYECRDDDIGCLFYVSIYDGSSAAMVVQIWEGWNATTHAGVGVSRKWPTTAYTFRISKAVGGWSLSAHDHHFIFISANWFGHFVGRPALYDESKNIVLFCGSANTPSQNPLSYSQTGADANGAWWCFLFDENGSQTNAMNGEGSGVSYAQTKYIKGIDGKYHFQESTVKNRTTGKLVGYLPGVASLGILSSGLVSGDIITVDGVDWIVNIVTQASIVRKD